MMYDNFVFSIAHNVNKATVCASGYADGIKFSIIYLGSSLLGSRYLFEAHCSLKGNEKKYSLYYSFWQGKTFLNDGSTASSIYGDLNFWGQRRFCVSENQIIILKEKKQNKTRVQMFVCDTEILAEILPYSILKTPELPNSDCFQILVKEEARFDIRILLLYILWKLIDSMELCSCGI